jgi:hypothetical protein
MYQNVHWRPVPRCRCTQRRLQSPMPDWTPVPFVVGDLACTDREAGPSRLGKFLRRHDPYRSWTRALRPPVLYAGLCLRGQCSAERAPWMLWRLWPFSLHPEVISVGGRPPDTFHRRGCPNRCEYNWALQKLAQRFDVFWLPCLVSSPSL